jgi:hypothetical protein
MQGIKPLKNDTVGRYLLDYDNPDAGIGHSLGHVNNAVKACMRNQLEFAYSDKQLIKSRKTDFKWRMWQFMRTIVGRKTHETHGIGDAICRMFAFEQFTASRDRVEGLIRKKRLKVVEIPAPDIEIPSNFQDDDVAYAKVDAFIRAHPEDGVAFVLPAKRTGDFEYAVTREWFKRSYAASRSTRVPAPATSSSGRGIRVALHIRRGDLLPGRQFSDLAHRMLPDYWYVQVLESLYKVTRCHLHIMVLSEGRDGKYCSELGLDFSWQQALRQIDCDVVEKIDHDFMESFDQMVEADVLIGSKSGMSHLAGLMNDNIKLVPRMWHSYRGASRVIELEDALQTDVLEASLSALWMAKAA